MDSSRPGCLGSLRRVGPTKLHATGEMRGSAGSEASDGEVAEGADRPERRANLDDHIYEHVKQMIANRALLPGQRIVPAELARDMGVSRTPMLSALKRLSQEQLLEWRSRRGVFVRHLSRRELALIFELREVLEGLAARRAAELIERRQVDAVEVALCRTWSYGNSGKPARLSAPGLSFSFWSFGNCGQPAAQPDHEFGQHHGLGVRGGPGPVDPREHGGARGDLRSPCQPRPRCRRGGHAHAHSPFRGPSAPRSRRFREIAPGPVRSQAGDNDNNTSFRRTTP